MRLQHFAQMRALEKSYQSSNAGFVDHLLNDAEKAETIRGSLRLRRIQADVVEELAEELDRVCKLLDISKRQFMEGAIAEAISEVDHHYRTALDESMGLPVGDEQQQLSLEV
jgi:GAF domain-containing protein